MVLQPASSRFAWVLAFLVSLITFDAFPQSILTFAGGGPIGDGQTATAAVLTLPADVEIDADGNIYIADTGNARVRRVDAVTGSISTVAGGGTSGFRNGDRATETQLYRVTGIELGTEGIFIADGDRVLLVEKGTGLIRTFAGGGKPAGTGDGGLATWALLRSVSDITLDAAGNLFISDLGDARVRRVDAVTRIITTVAGNGEFDFSGDGVLATLASLVPGDIDLDVAGNIYVADWWNHYVFRIDAGTGTLGITAGTGEMNHSGDGGPASQASISHPSEVALDASGNVYVAACCGVVRRIDHDTGVITRFAGQYGFSFGGDGSLATDALLNFADGLAFDERSNLFIADTRNHRIRRVDFETRIISTVAGGGAIGDGRPATAALLFDPRGIALDGSGDLYFADYASVRVRMVSAETGVITTVAGTGLPGWEVVDGTPATEADLGAPNDVAFDASGNLYIAAENGLIYRVEPATGIITGYAGRGPGYGGDGGPASQALFSPSGIDFDRDGNLFVADGGNQRIRRIDASTGIVTTVAGTGERAWGGDGGPATLALLNAPEDVAVDDAGNLFIADTYNNRIRRVDADNGIITTFVGGGDGSVRDGPATEVSLSYPAALAFDSRGDLYFGEGWYGSIGRVGKVNMETGFVTTLAGGRKGARGDGGPAIWASVYPVRGVGIDAEGNLYISDTDGARIRAIYACTDLEPPALVSPADGAIDLPTAPTLAWSESKRAYRYDVLFQKEGESGGTVASDLTTLSFTPQNLEGGARYFWRVRAKGDPYCSPISESLSEVRSFVVIPPCEAPGEPRLTSPTDKSIVGGPSATLGWNPVPRSSHYDVYFGTASPPPYFGTTAGTSISTPRLSSGNTYYWSVMAHASCDAALTARSEIRSFSLAGDCVAAGSFELREPGDGALGVPTTATLSWSGSENAASYDLFLGTTNPPAIFLPAMRETSVRISGLDPLRTYFWRVRANVSCGVANSLLTEVRQFTTGGTCVRPQGTSILFAPPGAVGVGQTYSISWKEANGLDAGGTYVVERSLDPSFSTILDTQELTGTTATFVAEVTGLHYHRVRPVARCDTSLSGANSNPVPVNVVGESANIIFTIEPEAMVSPTGRSLEDLEARFTIENISNQPVQAIIGRAEIESVPFFRIVDPTGGDAVFVTLQPREPKTFAIRFSGPPNDVRAAYQGLIVVNTAGSAIIPYAFVNLKIGDLGTIAPQFLVDGRPSEYAFFPGLDGNDDGRPPITVEIRNPGSSPMELGAEIGPEAWLEPEPGWNDSPIAAGGIRPVHLFTRRSRALNGSALPRYTYFTVRTKTGETARILIQDNGAAPVSEGRASALDRDAGSFIVPEVVSEISARGSIVVSKVRLTNLGSTHVQAELIFTPSGEDGFSTSVRRAVIVVPSNDVVTLSDPLVQVFDLTRPAVGQLEIRSTDEKLGLLSVESSIVFLDGSGSTLVRVPTVRRGDGARMGSPHQIVGIASTAEASTRLILTETGGIDGAAADLALFDEDGALLGGEPITIERHGHLRIAEIVGALGGDTPFSGGRLEITVTEGGGSVIGFGRVEDADGERGSMLMSEPSGDGLASSRLRGSDSQRSPSSGVTSTLVAPWVASGQVDPSGASWSTVMGFRSPFGTRLDFTVTFDDSSGRTHAKTITVPGGATVELSNAIVQLFGINGAAEGSIRVDADLRGVVYARLTANGLPAGVLDLVSTTSELVTMASSCRPLIVDGVAQSTDSSRGARWNLYVSEIAGQGGTVTVRLYEAGNRTHPIAVRDFAVAANGRLSLETIFDAMDLNTASRRKDRTNVLVVVTPRAGSAQVAAVALEIDNRTGHATPHTLRPASGLPASGVTSSLARVIDWGSARRRRPVRRDD